MVAIFQTGKSVLSLCFESRISKNENIIYVFFSHSSRCAPRFPHKESPCYELRIGSGAHVPKKNVPRPNCHALVFRVFRILMVDFALEKKL